MSTKIIHRADTRGHANHGWLDTHHTFSFAEYYNPDRIHFGALRVLNDDVIEGGEGFGTHPHNNMEIISIPLAGDLEHKDSMGNVQVIRQNDVQVMSAGSGIKHSEYNHNSDRQAGFLQIWVFPNEQNVKPRYQQMTFLPELQINRYQQVVSPNPDDDGLWIHQQAWFSLARPEKGKSLEYNLHNKNSGVYIFVINGKIEIADQLLNRRDGIGITDVDKITMTANENSYFLLMEVPMGYS